MSRKITAINKEKMSQFMSRTHDDFAKNLFITALLADSAKGALAGRLLSLRDTLAISQIIQELNLSDTDEKKVRDAVNEAGKRWLEEYLPEIISEKNTQA